MTPFDAFISLFKTKSLDTGYKLFIGRQGDTTANNQIVLVEYGGIADTQLPIERPFIQVNYYNTSQDVCKNNCWSAYKSLHRLLNTTVGDFKILAIYAKQTPFEMPAIKLEGNKWLYHRVFNVWLVVT